jgi:hypothetical protein
MTASGCTGSSKRMGVRNRVNRSGKPSRRSVRSSPRRWLEPPRNADEGPWNGLDPAGYKLVGERRMRPRHNDQIQRGSGPNAQCSTASRSEGNQESER